SEGRGTRPAGRSPWWPPWVSSFPPALLNLVTARWRFTRSRARHRCGLRPRLGLDGARRQPAGAVEAQRPIFPGPVGDVGHCIKRAGEPGLARGQGRELAEKVRMQLVVRIL